MNEITETRVVGNVKEHRHTLRPYWHLASRLHQSDKIMPASDDWKPVPRRYVLANDKR